MTRKFYLSMVYDAYGYDRIDLVSSDSLKKLDQIISQFSNRNEVVEKYLGEYNIDKKKGKVCLIYEDVDTKRREIRIYGIPEKYSPRERGEKYSYAHIIPIMYKNRRLMKIEACLLKLKRLLRDCDIIDSIMLDNYSEDKRRIKTNNKYLFETEEEKDYIDTESNYKAAINLFLKRIDNENEDDQYFYCRSLIDICKLGVTIIKTKKSTIDVYDGMPKRTWICNREIPELTESEKLELETHDMDEFYLHHDLDEVIRLSPNDKRPIGSEGRKEQNEKNNGWKRSM